MKTERDLLQLVANLLAQDYPPSEQIKTICACLLEAGILPEKTERPTLRHWPPRTQFAGDKVTINV